MNSTHNKKWNDDGTCFNDCQEEGYMAPFYESLDECCLDRYEESEYSTCMQATHSPSTSPTKAVSLFCLFHRDVFDLIHFEIKSDVLLLRHSSCSRQSRQQQLHHQLAQQPPRPQYLPPEIRQPLQLHAFITM